MSLHARSGLTRVNAPEAAPAAQGLAARSWRDLGEGPLCATATTGSTSPIASRAQNGQFTRAFADQIS